MNNRVKSADILRAPAHPLTGRQLLETVRDALEAELGYKLTIERFSAMIGKSISTTGYLLGVHAQSPVLAFICAGPIQFWERLAQLASCAEISHAT